MNWTYGQSDSHQWVFCSSLRPLLFKILLKMDRRIHLFAIFFLFLSSVFSPCLCFSQHWKNYSSADGLISNDVHLFFQDSRGFLWVGTHFGISRFDGESFKNFSLEDSVTNDEMSNILEDGEGTLWFVPKRGLKFYDGKSLRSLSLQGVLSTDEITDAYKDRSSKLWFGTRKGVARYDARDEEGKKLQTFTQKEGLGNNHITSILEDKSGNIWFATMYGGVTRYDGKNFTAFNTANGLPHNTVRVIALDSTGSLWFGTSNGLVRFDGKTFTALPLAGSLFSRTIYSILCSVDGTVWFKTGEKGVKWYDGKNITTFNAKNGFAGNIVNEIFQDRRGRVWFATDSGVCRFNADAPSGKKFEVFRKGQGLISNNAATIFEDQEGNLWFGTTAGFSVMVSNRFEVLRKDELARVIPGSHVGAITKDHTGNLWFPSKGGVGRYNGKQFEFFTEAGGQPLQTVHVVFPDNQKRIWLGTDQGIVVFEGGEFRRIKDNVVHNSTILDILEDTTRVVWFRTKEGRVIRYDGSTFSHFDGNGLVSSALSMQKDSKGQIWFEVIGGVVQYDGTIPKKYSLKEHILGTNLFYIFPDRWGNVWFGTDKGLTQFRDNQFTRIPKDTLRIAHIHGIFPDRRGDIWLYVERLDSARSEEVPNGLIRVQIDTLTGKIQRFTPLNKDHGLIDNRPLQGPFEDKDGNLWMMTSKGVSRYNLSVGKINQSYTVADGLGANQIREIMQDDYGSLWFATNGGGVSKFDGTFFSTFTHKDGLVDDDTKALGFDEAGNVWIRTNVGIVRHTPNTLCPVNLLGVTVDTVSYLGRDEVVLSHKENSISFTFRGINFSGETDDVRYLCKLEGHDKSWVTPPLKGKISYQGLSPGTYHFIVRAVNKDLFSSGEPTAFSFTIAPPFWQTWWFITLAIAVVGSSGYSAVRARLNRQLERARILNELKAAHDTQMSLMPSEDPSVPGLDISGTCKPAEEVGGDYFDYVWLDKAKTKFGIAIVDVSGKAMKAAMTAVMTSGMIYSEVENSKSARTLLQKLNKPMYLKTDKHIFTAMSFAVLNIKTKRLSFANAGQVHPLLLHDGKLQYITVKGNRLPLGIQQETRYNEVTLQLKSGDVIVFYTDGLPEAMNEKNELFGFDRLEQRIEGLSESSAREIRDKILEDVVAFNANAEQHDDMTVVVVKVV